MEDVINDYLWHGYLPPNEVPSWLYADIATPPQNPSYDPNSASDQLDNLFDRVIKNTRGPHLVPISGGWDSRLILGALSERATNIHTVSIGRPGQLDFDIGSKVSRFLGLQHHEINLDQISLEWERLKDSAKRAKWTYMPIAFFLDYAYRTIAEKTGAQAIWSGFLGDPLTGGHYEAIHSDEPTQTARITFSRNQKRWPENLPLRVKASHSQKYPFKPEVLGQTLNEYEFLDLAIRQRGCIAPLVLNQDWEAWSFSQQNIQNNPAIVTPFADSTWARYWLHAPRNHHQRQKLYRDMGTLRFPDLFSLPSKYTWGFKPHRTTLQYLYQLQHVSRNLLHRRHPKLPIRSRAADNYIDFQSAFKNRADYRAVLEKAIQALKKREIIPWLDLDYLLDEHYAGKKDHSTAFLILLGLAINLETNM